MLHVSLWSTRVYQMPDTNFPVRGDIGVPRVTRPDLRFHSVLKKLHLPLVGRYLIFQLVRKFHVSRENLPLCRSASAGWSEKRKKEKKRTRKTSGVYFHSKVYFHWFFLSKKKEKNKKKRKKQANLFPIASQGWLSREHREIRRHTRIYICARSD